MLEINLEALILASMTSVNGTRGTKRFTLGKQRISIHYTLSEKKIYINRINKMTKADKREKRLLKRRDMLIRNYRMEKVYNETIIYHMTPEQNRDINDLMNDLFEEVSAGTELKKGQTELEANESSNELFEKSVQTEEVKYLNETVQTSMPDVYEVGSQATCRAFVASTQTEYLAESLGSQTDWSYEDLMVNVNYHMRRLEELEKKHDFGKKHVMETTSSVFKNFYDFYENNFGGTGLDDIERVRTTEYMIHEFIEHLGVRLTGYSKPQVLYTFRQFCDKAADKVIRNRIRYNLVQMNSRSTQTHYWQMSEWTQTEPKKTKFWFGCR